MSGTGGVLVRTGLIVVAAVLLVALIVVLNLARVYADPPADPSVRAPQSVGPPVAETPTGTTTGQVTDAAPPVRVDPAWAERAARAAGIPVRAIEAYAVANLVIAAEQPECGIGWNTLAGIGAIESDHGRHDGAELGGDGYPQPAIRGPALDGDGVAAIPDTDGGRWDGDASWDRAVGPLQFIPDTWSRWGADANGDGIADPNQIDDAALAAARYLCASGPMRSVDGWRAAIFSYNHLDSYVDDVAAVANRYAAAVG
jgi:membrane-bound lytic murein transglycosylase B